MTIAAFIANATKQFADAGINTARLDALVLLSDALHQDKSWILAHQEDRIPMRLLTPLRAAIQARTQRMPLAYIRGRQEFYGRTFSLTASALVPRPDSEQLIDELKLLDLERGSVLLDVGTGSGALAITATLEVPGLLVEASDISQDALDVARSNAERLRAPIARFFLSDLLDEAGYYDVIMANLPYVAREWDRSPETDFEPELALFAPDGGLALIKKLLQQAPNHLTPDAHVILEADPRQFEAIKKAAPASLQFVRSEGFAIVFKKV
jgi:release factor glutamine methyltransferase